MLVYTFDYVNAKNVSSTRTLVPVTVPCAFYEGIDVSELSQAEQAEYITELEKVKQEYHNQLAYLENKFDLKHRYRRFKPESMTNVQTDNV